MSVSRAAAARRGEPAAALNDGGAVLSDADFHQVAALVESLTGIVVPIRKKQLVASRLSKRLRALGLADFGTYLARVAAPGEKDEIRELINVMTTNLTSFFREAHHFTDLAEVLKQRSHSDRVRIWSTACSTGEEPYSIAMTAVDAGLARPGADLRILATDLDTRALSTAREGIYSADRVEDCPPHLAKAHFSRTPDGRRRVSDRLRSMITFNQLNLHGDWPVRGPFDVIFCRNVLIYFDADKKKRIVGRLVDLLQPGGALYLGHSESMLGGHPDLVSEGHTIFRKRR